jgi:diphosphomevalonate decarboxylase
MAQVPSNIAFIKYWGKRDEKKQWPTNDSLSMTLSGMFTRTTARLTDAHDFSFALNGTPLAPDSAKGAKIYRHLHFLAHELGTRQKLDFTSFNSFPTACGIASSASGFGALTLAALAAFTDSKNLEELQQQGFDAKKLAQLSRHGSGSACRSMMGGIVQWQAGATPESQAVSQLFSREHWDLNDLIVILDDTPKAVSSSDGHRAAVKSPLFAERMERLPHRFASLVEAITARDIDKFGLLLEEEALNMHAVAESSDEGLRYMTEKTHAFINKFKELRKRWGLQAYFTCDAGPNVHLICEAKTVENLTKILHQEYTQLKILHDEIGEGPSLQVADQGIGQ